MKTLVAIIAIVVQICGTTHSLIIPDELPSLLSVIYSNIPTIKKGTDSRVGWGFRLGDRADFQVLVELGPQTNTQPLANQGSSSASKRNVQNNLRNILYAQQQQIAKQQTEKQQTEKQQTKEKHISNTDGSKWLKEWSHNMKNPQRDPVISEVPVGAKPGLGIGEIDAKSVIPDDSVLMSRELMKKKEKNKEENTTPNKKEISLDFADKLYGKKIEEVRSTTLKPKTTTSAKDALDNVDMEEDTK